MTSIRQRLLMSLITGLLVLTAVMVEVAYIDSTQEIHELFIDNLRRMAVVIEGQAFPSGISSGGVADIDTGELEESYVIQIWSAQGKLQRSSRPDTPLPLQAHEGLSTIKQSGQTWEIYTLKAANSGYVQIAQPKEIVSTMIGESAERALIPFLLLVVLLAICIWFVVGRSLVPLHHLSKTIGEWEADNMQPIKVADAPVEIQPVIHALNGMLLKLDKAISMQRQFTADSAHELRTPLTAIKLQLENLIQAQSGEQRKHAEQRLSEGVERCIHLATQLLSASRSMAVKTSPEFLVVDFNELVRSSVATFAGMAADKNIDIAFESEPGIRMLCDEEGIRALANNLIDNAIRYTPPGGKVFVRLTERHKKPVFEVSDTGSGIPGAERENIFRRFYRIPGTQSTGSGLGLSIVRTVAENHGAFINVTEGPFGTGTIVRVIFSRQSGA